jgi:hypothetical protein
MRFYIPNCCIYWTGHENGDKGRTAVAVKEDIPHTCADLPPFLSVEAAWVSAY